MAMTYIVRMLVYSSDGWLACHGRGAKTRDITTRFAGCVDADDARRKARETYAVAAFKRVEPVEKEG